MQVSLVQEHPVHPVLQAALPPSMRPVVVLPLTVRLHCPQAQLLVRKMLPVTQVRWLPMARHLQKVKNLQKAM